MDPMTMMALSKGVNAIGQFGTGIMTGIQGYRRAGLLERQAEEASDLYGGFAEQAEGRMGSYGDTEYGKFLQRISEEGLYGAREEQRMMSRVARETGGVEAQARQRYLGQLASQGLAGSVAGARGLNELSANRMQAMASARENIERAEVEAQRSAEESYSRGATSYTEQARSERDRYLLAAMQAGQRGEAGAMQARQEGAQAFLGATTLGASTAGQSIAAGFQAQDINTRLDNMIAQYQQALDQYDATGDPADLERARNLYNMTGSYIGQYSGGQAPSTGR